ncbi:unnamed protein product [Adineta steineri]|uniref:Uncharacterized protein n=1 Tax=Adineta steineri TaxID=433720 RepID=A0A819VMU5_9BILA|nr:unnamed protein product [Adineta steineri]CAF4111062.1 unnamed protein product [Adineta steineri]
MAFSVSTKSIAKETRSESTIYTATSRDYDRKKLAAKQEVKHEKDFDALERKMISHAKWNQRAENNKLRPNLTTNQNPSSSSTSLDDFIQRGRNKQDNMINAKRMGNESIRRTSMNTVPKV